MELLRKNLVLIGIVAIVILGGIWYSLSAGGSEGTIEVTEGGVLQQTEGDPEASGDPDVLKLLLDMRAIKLDGRLFKSPAFRALQDTGKQILAEPKGRVNPFAPAGSIQDADFGDTQGLQQNQQGGTQPAGNEQDFAE